MNTHKTNIFNTPIWGYLLNNEQYQAQDYLEFIEQLKNSEASVSKSNAGGGWQSRDDIQNEPLFREFVNNILLKSVVSGILNEYNIRDFTVQSMWANVNGYGSFNYHHTHEGYLSGVFYLKVPTNSGRLVFTNPAVRSDGHPIRSFNYPITPQPLALIVFPSWLEHYVEPNESSESRVSISFNIGK